MFESLESRRHLAVSFGFTIDTDGVETLTIGGTKKNDQIVLTQETTYTHPDVYTDIQHVFITARHNNGPQQVFEYTSTGMDNILGKVIVKSGAGNDVVEVQNFDHYSKGTPMLHVQAGSGNDTIFGKNGIVHVDGGAGNDTLTGQTGVDPLLYNEKFAFFFHGGPGKDLIIGSNFQDYLSGDEGADRVIARGGDDYATQQGRDYLNMGAGNDTILKLDYYDNSPATILGSDGVDKLYVEQPFPGAPLWPGIDDLFLDSIEEYEMIPLKG